MLLQLASLVMLAAPTIQAVSAPEAASAGVPWWLYALIAIVVAGAGVALLLVSFKRGQPTEEICPNCGKVVMSDWPRCMFCKAPRNFRKAALQFVSGPLQGTTIDLDGDVTTIGSAPGSTVLIADAGVSRKHCGIKRAEDGYEVADLGSKNGVYVNGEKVARKKLALGDVIRIGASEMIFKS